MTLLNIGGGVDRRALKFTGPARSGPRFRRLGWARSALPLALLVGAGAVPTPALAQACAEVAIRAHLEAIILDAAQPDAINALNACGDQAIPGLVAALADSDNVTRSAAIAALHTVLQLPTAQPAWVDQSPTLAAALIDRLQTDDYFELRQAAAAALGTVARLSQSAARQQTIAQALLTALDRDPDPNPLTVRIAVVNALAQIPSQAESIAPVLLARLADPAEGPELRRAAASTLTQLNQVDALVANLQNNTYSDDLKPAIAAGLRPLPALTPAAAAALVATLQSDHGELASEAATTLRALVADSPQATGPLLLPHLETLVANLQRSGPTDLANTVDILVIASAAIARADLSAEQRAAHLKTLKRGLQTLRTHPRTDALQLPLGQAIGALEGGNPALDRLVAEVMRTGATTLLFHSLFWLGLVALYPTSPQVQAIFFWNPRVRKIFGLYYVEVALTWVPWLRAKLFAPFRANLLAEADLGEIGEAFYFAGSDVLQRGQSQPQPLVQAVPELKGQVVLEGESGLGKTMAVKQLVNRTRRLAVYLPARKCAGGVIEAIQERLQGPTQDTEFLQSLIYSGAIDICIDGLNEVTPDTRAKISLFADTYFKGNLVITTQPMDWEPPTNATVYELQPLTADQIGAFLRSRVTTLPPTALLQGAAYEQACQTFLNSLNPDHLGHEVMAKTLSNPMELTLVAQMLAAGKQPDLLNLQQQQYDAMASRYQHINLNQPFPLAAFAEMAYEMRLGDQFTIPADPWFKELNCMEDYRMVLSRQLDNATGGTVTEWRFRHEKIQDFFIVQTFWGKGNERPAQHLGDPRFRGVYFLLATALPLDQAMVLREQLITHAVKTKDHTVSDRFIELLQSRSAA